MVVREVEAAEPAVVLVEALGEQRSAVGADAVGTQVDRGEGLVLLEALGHAGSTLGADRVEREVEVGSLRVRELARDGSGELVLL